MVLVFEKKKRGGEKLHLEITRLRGLQKLCFVFYLYVEIERNHQLMHKSCDLHRCLRYFLHVLVFRVDE